MKRLYLLISAVTLWVLITLLVAAQSPGSDPNSKSLKLTASVERLGEKLYLQLTNTSETREFRGAAQIVLSGGANSAESVRLELEVGAGKTRIFPFKATTEGSDHYSLTIHNLEGALLFYQDAPIKQTSRESLKNQPSATQLARPAGEELRVQPRLAAKTETAPRVLTFELKSPSTIPDASLTISAKDFKQHQAVSIRKSAQVEFKLPDELKETAMTYTLTDATGRVRASGEFDLDQLLQADSIIVTGVNLDKPSYAPGESARISFQLQGQTPRGYRLDVLLKDGDRVLYKDQRRNVVHNTQTRVDFVIELPSEQKTVIFEYSFVGVQTGRQLAAGIREISVSGKSVKEKIGDGSLLPP